MEFVVRRQLTREQQSLAGLYEGNPKRTTARPTAEKLLVAFQGITLYFHSLRFNRNYSSQFSSKRDFSFDENFRIDLHCPLF